MYLFVEILQFILLYKTFCTYVYAAVLRHNMEAPTSITLLET
jgi:hypothetical protein